MKLNREDVSILVVDDVNTMRIQIKELLTSFGFRKVSFAANGEEAKKFLESQECHLVMCDMHMEPTSGIDVLRFVRATKEKATLAFIMVTADSTVDAVKNAIKEGVDDYLVKPLTPKQIEIKVYGVLLKKGVL
jgi:two-component system, chemotaxis family, chemotaxis protein CheY